MNNCVFSPTVRYFGFWVKIVFDLPLLLYIRFRNSTSSKGMRIKFWIDTALKGLVLIAVALSVACTVPQIALVSPLTAVDDKTKFVLRENLTVEPQNSKPTVLKRGTVWRRIGTIEQGNVFSTQDQVVIVNSFNVHEADIVTRNGSIVGLLLKVSDTFVGTKHIPIKLESEEL